MRAAAVLILALSGALHAEERLTSISIHSTRTKPAAVRKLLDCQENAPFSLALWEQDIQRLKNTGLFYLVEGRIEGDGPEKSAQLNLKNKFSTIPILKYKQGGGTSLLTVGLYEVNLFDRLLEAGGQYERINAKDGFVVWLRHPYLGGQRNHFGTELYVHTIDLPLLDKHGTEQADFENEELRWNVRLKRELLPELSGGIEISAYQNRFAEENSTMEKAALNQQFLAANFLQPGRTVSVTPRLFIGKIRNEGHRFHGHEAVLECELAHKVLGSEFNFAKAQAGATGGLLAGPRWNFAYQAKIGTKTGHEFQHKFYLGGLDTIRGFLDKQFRGEHIWLANLEARSTITEKPLWILQGNLFADFGKTWDARNFGKEGFSHPFTSLGAGLRLIFPRIYRAVLRLDIARTAQPVKQTGLSLGLQQFF